LKQGDLRSKIIVKHLVSLGISSIVLQFMAGQARLARDAIAMLPKRAVSAKLFNPVGRHFIVRDGNGEVLSKEMTFRVCIIMFLMVAFGTLAPTVSNGAENRPIFFSGIEDLPLAPGLHEIRGEGLIYDTSAGRIVQAYAQGRGTVESIVKFYQVTLPQLGWQVLGKTTFRREAETLEFKVSRAPRGARLAVRLTPAER
jgi:hypothetical protein